MGVFLQSLLAQKCLMPAAAPRGGTKLFTVIILNLCATQKMSEARKCFRTMRYIIFLQHKIKYKRLNRVARSLLSEEKLLLYKVKWRCVIVNTRFCSIPERSKKLIAELLFCCCCCWSFRRRVFISFAQVECYYNNAALVGAEFSLDASRRTSPCIRFAQPNKVSIPSSAS